MVFYLGCIKIICFLGINMIFVIVIDFFKKVMYMLVVVVFCMLFLYLNVLLIIWVFGELILLCLYSKFVNCLVNWLRNNL